MSKTPKTVTHPPIALATGTFPAASTSNPSQPSAPAATSQPVVTAQPASLTLPPIPAGFTPVSLANYRGYFPKKGQLGALAQALIEVDNATEYDGTFGSAAPPGPAFVQSLQLAAEWTKQRVALESYLTFVRSQEAVAWKVGLTKVEQLNAVFQLVEVQNPGVAKQYPALTELLDVPKSIGKKGAASLKRSKATKATAPAASTTPATTPATPAPAAAAPAATPTPAAPVPATGA